jgi:protein tyrosine/serine phosphatase
MENRLLALEGVSNFRDYGGYPTLDGRRIKTGKLYRSAHHGRASDADLDAIAALGIEVIVDLRRKGEREREPSRRHHAFAGRVIDNDIGDTTEDPWHLFVRGSDLSAEAFREHGLGYYRDAPFEARHIDLYSRYFRTLAETDGAVLIHCAAGKDRTGMLAALTHHLLGVSRENIVADFLLTNAALDYDRLVPVVTEMMFTETGRRPTPEAVRVAMGVHESYLERAFVVIASRHGGLDGYLHDVLGVDEALKQTLRARLLE